MSKKPDWFPRTDAQVLALFPASVPIAFDPHVLRAVSRAGFLDLLTTHLAGRIMISPAAERLMRRWEASWPASPASHYTTAPPVPTPGYLADQLLVSRAQAFVVEEYWFAPGRTSNLPKQKKRVVDNFVVQLAIEAWGALREPEDVRLAVAESLAMAIRNGWLFVSHFDYVRDHTSVEPMPFGLHHLLGCIAREGHITDADAWQKHLDALGTRYIGKFRPGPALRPSDRQDFCDFVAGKHNIAF
jgi:hypothetical protein